MKKSFLRFILCLLALLTLSLGLLGCDAPFQPHVQPTPTLALDPQQTWIKQHALVLKTTDPNAPLDDLASLSQLVGNASLVGLGEGTHGSHEFFTMKHRLLEFLVEKMGFTMFAMEGSWSAGETINQYVLNGQGNAADVLQLFHFWTWNTQEVLALLKWMRAYNADPQHTQKVSFAGFDCQGIEINTYDAVTHYLQSVDLQNVAQVSPWYQGLRPDPTISMRQYATAYQALPQQTKQQYITNAQKVYDLLKQNKDAYVAHSSSQLFDRALQEARVIVQGAQLLSYGQGDYQQYQAFVNRDTFMAENIAWLHEHNPGGAKMVLWAHDGHIGTQGTYGTTMGMQLRERYQSQYLAIGMSFYKGSFNAIGEDSQGKYLHLQPFSTQASPDSYNSELGTLGLPLYALDLRHLPSGPVSQWMNTPRPFLEVGALYKLADQNYSYILTALPQMFDVVISIENVTASQLIPLKN